MIFQIITLITLPRVVYAGMWLVRAYVGNRLRFRFRW